MTSSVTQAPGRRPGVKLLAVALAVLAMSALIEWLGWRIAWRYAPRAIDSGWWFDFARGVLRTAGAAAIVGAVVTAVGLVLPPTRSQVRRTMVLVFGAGAGLFLGVLLGLTLWAG